MTRDPSTLATQVSEIYAQLAAGEACTPAAQAVIDSVIAALDQGELRVAECHAGHWQTNSWIQEAILSYFRYQPMLEIPHGPFAYHDKIPLKTDFAAQKVRCVPPATVRYGAFLEPGVVLMPSYVNIGARVGARSMVDTWATVGSCAQVGCDVHLAGGVGIGGVLEPAGTRPVIIEDGVFIGSRCIVVEGMHVGQEAVLAANVTLTASMPIVDTRTSPFTVTHGSIPARAVVVAGTRTKELAGGQIQMPCAYIIGERTASTDRKVSLNAALREHALSV